MSLPKWEPVMGEWGLKPLKPQQITKSESGWDTFVSEKPDTNSYIKITKSLILFQK